MLAELKRWQSLGAIARRSRKYADNILDYCWVLKWEMINGNRQVKARLTVRGYTDLLQSFLRTYSATTTRWGR